MRPRTKALTWHLASLTSPSFCLCTRPQNLPGQSWEVGNRKRWTGVGKTVLSLSSLPRLVSFESGQICPHVLSGLCWGICKQKGRHWLRRRNAPLAHSPASWQCLHLQAPGRRYTDPLRHLSAPGNSRSVNTLAERSAKTHYLKMSEQTCLRGNRSCKVILMSPHVSDLKAVFACGLLTSNVFLLLLAFNKTLLKIWRWQKSTQRGASNCCWKGYS